MKHHQEVFHAALSAVRLHSKITTHCEATSQGVILRLHLVMQLTSNPAGHAVLVPAVKRLTGVCLDGTLSLPKDVLLLVTFLCSSPKNDAVLEWSLKINKAEAEFKDQNAAAVCLLPLLASYFQENLGELFQLHQVTTEITEEFRNSLPASPVIVALGRSLFECSCQLFVDHEVMVEDVGFLQAVELLFALYYCLNIQYAKGAGTTLEFIQRYQVGIKQHDGSRQEAGRSKGARARAIKAATDLAAFEKKWNSGSRAATLICHGAEWLNVAMHSSSDDRSDAMKVSL
ncbi:uncharacterized protein LOC115322682 isoform X1 [Ixodes scapularis]|uniref:uncharacterized protein LOC115322682 isoform X1 n=1 Tax=Ixodes scapularis TaxID=6945 RepID=UPI001C381B62|nr:uncharacterized protein LOC115322682 isoform X1 [Ixodes scapularis]